MKNAMTIGPKWWQVERTPSTGRSLTIRATRKQRPSQAKMLKVKQVAERMNCSIWKIYERIKDHSLFAEWDGGEWRIPEYAIDDFYDAQRALKKA